MKKNGFAAFLRRKQYVIAGAIVIVAAVATTVIYSGGQEQERKQMEAELAEEQNEPDPQTVASTEEKDETAQASAVIPPKQAEDTQKVQSTEQAGETEASEGTETAEIEGANETNEDVAATGATKSTLHFAPEDGMIWPMKGDVILNYSMDSTVYYATLDQYKLNPAVIIAGEVNDEVYSVAKGKIADISSNEVTGCTMTVDLGDGYQAIYGQLKEPNFKVGDYVESGHVLGYVAEPTKYFSVEGSNLYFALQKDGQPVDPVEFFES